MSFIQRSERAPHMPMMNAAQWLFLLTGLTLAYLVLPPFFFILHTSLVIDRGLQAGSFTLQHFENIVESLGDIQTLLANSVIFSVGSAGIALAYGTALAWLAERSNAPFRRLAYVSAYVSFAIPGIIKVVGWIMLLGPKAGILNAGVEVLTTKIYLQIKGGLIPKYGEASAYSIVLIALVALGLYPYYRITSKTYKFTTISGKAFRPHRIDLGRWRWLGACLMLILPLLQFLPIVAIAWSSFLPFAQVPSRRALSLLTLNNYVSAFNDSGISRSIFNSLTVSTSAATIAIVITFFAAWLIVRATMKARWVLDQMAMLPLVFPGIVMGI